MNLSVKCAAWMMVIFYVIVQSRTGVRTFRYEGMSQQTVDALQHERQKDNPGTTYQFVTKAVYDAVISSAPVSILPARNVQ